MAIDPRISLGIQVAPQVNVADIFNRIKDQQQGLELGKQNIAINEQTIAQQTGVTNDANNNRILKSLNDYAVRNQPQINEAITTGNPDNLIRGLVQRKADLTSQGLPTRETDEGIAMLQQGDIKGFTDTLKGAVSLFNQQNGSAKEQSGFTLSQGQQRFDASGNSLAIVAPKDIPLDKPKVGTFRFIETPTGIAKLNTITGEQDETILTSKEIELARKQTLEQTKAQLKQSDTTFDRSKKIRDRHDKLSGEFVKVRDSFDRVRESQQTAAGDIALIFNYMKMLDPGSVVREGEFATAQNAGGVDDRVLNSYNRLLTGERLNPKQRTEFESQAGKLFDIAEVRNKSLIKETISLGKQFNVTEANIFGNSPQTSARQPTVLKFDAQGNQIQ
jgi:hypothetical protein